MSFLFPTLAIPARQRRPGWVASQLVRFGKSKRMISHPAPIVQPLAVSYGMGTDSTALLVLLVEQVQRTGDSDLVPDRIQFADTGSEKDRTYPYIDHINPYLERNGFPTITLVRRGGQDRSLDELCLRLRTMPSLAYGGKSCSLKWKGAAMDSDLARQDYVAVAKHVGLPVLKLIGYDASPADLRRSDDPGDKLIRFHYPLRDAGLTRPFLMEVIAAAGLPQPGKSACFMCPAAKPHEVVDLARTEPHNLIKALRMEAKAMLRTAQGWDKPKPWSTRGLGRRWSWRELLQREAPELLATILASVPDGAGEAEWQEYLVHAQMHRDMCEAVE